MNKPLIIFHDNCADGFCSAWVAYSALGDDVELYADTYGNKPPFQLAEDRDVYILDFSYPREDLIELHSNCSKLVVLDHHKTAAANLEGLPYATFDMNRSGAGMTWDYFHPGCPRLWVVNYVEDRDLWRFKLPNSKTVALRIGLASRTFPAWDAVAVRGVDCAYQEGLGAELYLERYIAEALSAAYTLHDVDGKGTDATVVNMSYTGVSDVLAEALALTPFAIAWHLDTKGDLACSIRSAAAWDCSAFAVSMGGGGHAQAAGFNLNQTHSFAQRLLTGK